VSTFGLAIPTRLPIALRDATSPENAIATHWRSPIPRSHRSDRSRAPLHTAGVESLATLPRDTAQLCGELGT
jgi:hypothetical protein